MHLFLRSSVPILRVVLCIRHHRASPFRVCVCVCVCVCLCGSDVDIQACLKFASNMLQFFFYASLDFALWLPAPGAVLASI